jgi:hypothetical protein
MNNKMSQTLNQVLPMLLAIVGREFHLPITKDKGSVGNLLQDCLGIPRSSNCLDLTDGEVKCFPLRKLRDGSLVPKESIAVTMLDRDELKSIDFEHSRCYKKIERMLIVPYLRTEDFICFMKPSVVDKNLPQYTELYAIFKTDYDEIRQKFLDTSRLESRIGKLLQNRTKGPGHGSTSRAFYFRPAFMRQYIPISS